MQPALALQGARLTRHTTPSSPLHAVCLARAAGDGAHSAARRGAAVRRAAGRVPRSAARRARQRRHAAARPRAAGEGVSAQRLCRVAASSRCCTATLPDRPHHTHLVAAASQHNTTQHNTTRHNTTPHDTTSTTPQELGDVRPDVADAVAKLCCAWWTCEAANREFLVSQALPYLLVRRQCGGGCAGARSAMCPWQQQQPCLGVQGGRQSRLVLLLTPPSPSPPSHMHARTPASCAASARASPATSRRALRCGGRSSCWTLRTPPSTT
jgi:hypothetical protein